MDTTWTCLKGYCMHSQFCRRAETGEQGDLTLKSGWDRLKVSPEWSCVWCLLSLSRANGNSPVYFWMGTHHFLAPSTLDVPPTGQVYPLTKESMLNSNHIVLFAFDYLLAKFGLCWYFRSPSKDVNERNRVIWKINISYRFCNGLLTLFYKAATD